MARGRIFVNSHLSPREKAQAVEEKGTRAQYLQRIVREQEPETLTEVERMGTNYILGELFGMSHRQINEYANWYGPELLKQTSRVAAKNKYMNGPAVDFRYLFEAVYQLGSKTVSNLLRNGTDIAELMTDFAIHHIREFKVLTPSRANILLEDITSKGTLRAKGLEPVYTGQNVMIMDYAQR